MTGEQKADRIQQASRKYLRATARRQYPSELRKEIAADIALEHGIGVDFFIKLIVWNGNYEIARFNS